MWNWLVSGLATGATLLLYDGSPFHPDGNVLFDYADAEKMTYFGTSAKFIDTRAQGRPAPIDTTTCRRVRTITSTGSPLSPEGFAFVYEGIKQDVHLASISGGTDIVSCFVLGIPTEPVWTGEIQGPGLGLAVDVWDDDGTADPRREGRTRLHQGVPVDADRLLERSRRREIPRRLFRALRQCLVPWRLRRMDRAWRHDHPWPLRRDAQSGRRAHRHGRDLQSGRADAGDRSRRCASARTGTTTCASCCSCGWRRASRSTRSCETRITQQDPHRLQPAPRAGEDRRGRRHSAHQVRQDRRTCGARRRARPRSRTRRRWPTRRRWSSFATSRFFATRAEPKKSESLASDAQASGIVFGQPSSAA